MDQGVVDSPVTLVIRAPNQKYDDQTINCYQNWTVEKLKAHLSDVYPSKPVSDFAPVLSKRSVSVSLLLWLVLNSSGPARMQQSDVVSEIASK